MAKVLFYAKIKIIVIHCFYYCWWTYKAYTGPPVAIIYYSLFSGPVPVDFMSALGSTGVPK